MSKKAGIPEDFRVIYVDIPETWVCEHCGWEWTEESDTYNGGCCDADEQARAALNAEPQS